MDSIFTKDVEVLERTIDRALIQSAKSKIFSTRFGVCSGHSMDMGILKAFKELLQLPTDLFVDCFLDDIHSYMTQFSYPIEQLITFENSSRFESELKN